MDGMSEAIDPLDEYMQEFRRRMTNDPTIADDIMAYLEELSHTPFDPKPYKGGN